MSEAYTHILNDYTKISDQKNRIIHRNITINLITILLKITEI